MSVPTFMDRDVFVGRVTELEALHALLAQVRSGHARTVLLTGPAGIGKTALIDRFLRAEDDIRVLRAGGESWETLVSYGVIDQLMRVAGLRGARLVAGRQDALPAEEPVGVGTWVLEVLENLAQQSPVVVVVDDAHWADTDSLRAILFAARRLVADRVLMVFAVREESISRIPDGLRRVTEGPAGTVLALSTLGVEELRRLAVPFGVPDLSARTAQRLCEHTRGNPLYMRALLAELPPERWRTWEPTLPAPRLFAEQIERRLQACNLQTRRLVEAAAAVGAHASVAIIGALAAVADPLPSLEEAEIAGLLQVRDEPEARVAAFTHPLVQAAIYEQIGPAGRARLHHAAAELVLDEGAALRHRVAATAPPDDSLAADLDAFARRQEASGGWAAAASALVEASRMSSGRGDREDRLLRAVDAMIGSGDLRQASAFSEEIRDFDEAALRDAALGYLAVLRADPSQAELALHRAWSRCEQESDDRVSALVAQRLALHAIGRLDGRGIVEWTERVLDFPLPDELVRVETEAIRGLGLGWSGRLADGFDVHESIVKRLGGGPAEAALAGRAQMGQGWLKLVADDIVGARALLTDAVLSQLRSGSFRIACWAYVWLSRADFLAGDWDSALVNAERAIALLEESGHEWLRPLARWTATGVVAARGEWRSAEEHVRLGAARDYDYELMIVAAAMAKGQLATAKADHHGVLRAFEPVLAIHPRDAVDEPGFWPWQDIYADALVSVGLLEQADAFVTSHERRAADRGRGSSIARLARVRGRLEAAAGRAQASEEAFQRGLAELERLPMPFERALLELAYGQMLRRFRQRRAAAEHLASAHARFTELQAQPYALRCERELTACGLLPAKRHAFDPNRLTAQELAIARLVAEGESNKNVAAKLFVSTKTVQTHLTRIYAKLGVGSRTQLAARLRADPAPVDDAPRDEN